MSALTPAQPEETYQLGTRIGELPQLVLLAVLKDTGSSKRKAVENAILYTYADYIPDEYKER